LLTNTYLTSETRRTSDFQHSVQLHRDARGMGKMRQKGNFEEKSGATYERTQDTPLDWKKRK